MNQTQTRSLRKKVLSLILAVVMVVSLLPISAFASGDSTSTTAATTDGYDYNIMFLDCGRKYYSVDSIKKIIDKASAAGFNYIQLAVGNDGLRFLLDDMSLTVEEKTYEGEDVSKAIHAGNEKYHDFNIDELTQTEMDTIIAYANSKGMGVIPCVNTPGHMDAILSAASSLTNTTCSYNGSARTIDVTNNTAVKFTQALLQKYINYFAGKGCQLFNMGADEYANDKYTGGSMGFGQLQSQEGGYAAYVKYVNAVAKMIKDAGMKPMAFNDGIYFNGNTSSGTFDTDIIICYWSSGWDGGYTPMSAESLAAKGFKLINTNGSYYWVLGKTDAQCSADKAKDFDKTSFPGGTISDPVGSMFCIWADYPGTESEASVITKTADTIAAFGKALPEVPFAIKNAAGETSAKMTVDAQMKLSVNAEATWSVTAGSDVVRIAALTRSTDVTGTSVTIEALKAGSAEITATNKKDDTATFAVTVDEPKTETITVAAGDTVKINVSGEFSGTLDNKFAQVTTQINPAAPKDKKEVKSTDELESGKQYLIFNNRKQALLTSTASNDWRQAYYGLKLDGTASADNETDLWTISGSNGSYTVKNTAGNYLTIGEKTASVGSESATLTLDYKTSGNESYWNISQNSYYLNHLGSSTTAGGYKYDSAATDLGSKWTIYKITGGDASTDITFTGVEVGTTSVTIGGVKYNIKVVSAELAKVTPLTIEYWITNRQVTADGATSKIINATDSTIYSEAGAKLSDLVPAEGVGKESGANTVFWKGTRLTSKNEQNTDKGNDKTNAGDDFTYIRYWEGKWAFSADGTEWTAFNADDQAVAYYLQKTNVTNEVETQVVDWGNDRSGYDYATWVLLDYAVKYESGDRTPDDFPVTNKTLAFHCDYTTELGNTVIADGSTYYRMIGAIRAEESDDYEVYMITVTPTSDTKTEQISATGSANTANSYEYKGTEKVVWVDDKANLGDFANENLQYEGFHVGGDATVPGLNIYNKQGMLVTYYVRAKETTDSLHVHYIDRTANDFEFYNYNIVVNSATTFDPAIALNSENPNDVLYKGTVTNSLNKEQTVSANLSAMPQIGAQYRFSDYKCVEVRRGDDGKDVYLYYTFTNSKTFVVDFGLPLEIAPADMNSDLQDKVEKVSVGNAATLRYGTVDVKNSSVDGYKVVYNLNKPIDNNETINLTYSGTNVATNKEGAVTWNANIIPATNVYYEDSFATFTNVNGSTGVDKVANTNGYWVTDRAVTADSDAKQALEELGSKQNVYGYDAAYNTSSEFSMGSAAKVTVDANTSSQGQSPTATFTFKGTGFDVISLTGNQSGTVMYTVTNKAMEESFSKIVNTYYGYKFENGKWTTTDSADPNALYQIPVIREVDLGGYGEYEVTISVLYGKYFNSTANDYYSFWLDAIRVYDPMGKDNDTYKDDGEGYPQYIKLRDSLVAGTANAEAVFIDGGATAEIKTTYANFGPNNEVYLENGQAISFKIEPNANIASIQIGAKTPNGTANMTVNNKEVVQGGISTATEMYYEIATSGGNFTITNTGDGILSLTNVKVTYKTNPTDTASLATLTTEDQENAVAQVRALFAAPVQEPFNPDRFDVSWSRNVRKGDTAKLTVKTSEDVEAITVNGETIASYVERNERTGWGWWAKTVTYREFTYTTTADVTKDFMVCAVNAAGVSSEAKTATLTVRPSVRDWLHGIIGKWF